MRLGTHIRASRTAKGLTVSASSLVSGIPIRRFADIEEGDRLPTGDELAAIATTHGLDSQSVFLWATEELMERMLARGTEGATTRDEDLFDLWDQMAVFLAERGRI